MNTKPNSLPVYESQKTYPKLSYTRYINVLTEAPDLQYCRSFQHFI